MSEPEQEKLPLGYQAPVVPPASRTRRWACLLAFVLGVANLILGLGYGFLFSAQQLGKHLDVGSGEISLNLRIPGPLLIATLVAFFLSGVLYLFGAIPIRQANRKWTRGLFVAALAQYFLVAIDILLSRNAVYLDFVALFGVLLCFLTLLFCLVYRDALEQRRVKRDKARAV